jgi:PKD repeat protein
VELRPLASADDAEQTPTGSMYLNSSDLEMVMDATAQTVGLRWPGLTIPKGATITAAWIQFTAEESQTEATQLTIRAQAADNAPGFTATKFDVTNRATGSASVNWSPAAWTSGQAGAAQRTPDLSQLVQQVVDRAGWASGNALVMVISGTGKRVAQSQDGSPVQAALLHVEYTTSGGPPPNVRPVASLSVTQAASPPLTVNASGAGSTDSSPIASYRFDFGDGTAPVVVNAPATGTTHTYAAAGTYSVTLLVTDTGGLTSAPATASITVSGGGGPGPGPGPVTTVEQRTLATADDAEEASGGAVALSSSDLELVQDSNTQTVGMRWPSLAIPRGAVITAAWVQFTARESHSGATQLTFRAQAADNAGLFTTATQNVSSRPRTSASVNWTPAAWAANAAGPDQRTPELKTLIQEVVNRSGWASGNALAIIVTGSGRRTALSRDGNKASAPLLHVEFTTGPVPEGPPTARLTVTQLASPARTVSASGAASTDPDNSPIASYRFEWGDGTAATVTQAPTAVATHTYAATGTYTVTLRVTDTAGRVSDPATATITVTANTAPALAVYLGYYSTHHPDDPQPKPNPWMGSSGVVFVGTPDSPSGGWDTSAIRIDNNTGASVTMTVVVDIGSDRFALWGSRTVPAGQKLILAQTGFENFDGSDTNEAGCYDCDPRMCLTHVKSTVPVVRVTISGQTTLYYDTQQILNTRGVDAAGCPPTSGRLDESQNWVSVLASTGAAPPAMSSSTDLEGMTRANSLWFERPVPNPVRGEEVGFRFHVPRPGRVQLTIFDVAGRVVTEALDHDLQPGEYHKLLQVRGIMAGRYFALLRTPDGQLQQSFVIMR